MEFWSIGTKNTVYGGDASDVSRGRRRPRDYLKVCVWTDDDDDGGGGGGDGDDDDDDDDDDFGGGGDDVLT